MRDVCAREGVEALVYDEEFAEIVGGVEPRRGSFLGWTDSPTGEPTLEALVAAGDPRRPAEAAGHLRGS